MKKLSVLIISNDTDYCSAVTKYFRFHYSDSVTIVTCSSLNNISEYIINNNISIILAEEEFRSGAAAAAGKCVVYGLAENKTDDDSRTVCKYISAVSLYNELLFIYSQCTAEDKGSFDTGSRIYTFISVNGCGATTLSVAFAKRLAADGKKVLYLGLDGLSDYNSIFSVTQERGISDIIMALKSKSSNATMVAKSATHRGNVSFIDKCRCPDDIYEIDDEETAVLFDRIISSDDYDCLVVDISFAYVNLWKYAAKNSERIFCVTANKTSSIAKTNNFIEAVKIRDFRNSTDAFSRTSVIVNRTSDRAVCSVACENLLFVSKYSAEDYNSLTDKISMDTTWNDYIKG